MRNYVAYHVHTELSLLDSATNYKLYVDKAVELDQKAICFTEHGNILMWVEKKMYCDKQNIKYLHGIECYLTKTHSQKERDNYHTILIAKNYQGVLEINRLIELSSRDDHKYYKDRISFNEFFSLSPNVIKISACLSSPLNKIPEDSPLFEELLSHYDYLEVQPHHCAEQIAYNKKLSRLSKKYGIPLIAGTDTHSIDHYKAECRELLQKAKGIFYASEEAFDLTYKSYDQLVEMFKIQGALQEEDYLEALENTQVMADSVEEFTIDTSFKYPKPYENEEQLLLDRIQKMYQEKLSKGIIQDNPKYMENIKEEYAIFKKIGMCGFMLFMSELMCWCWEQNIPSSPCRGSVGGSTIAYITDITDVNPIVWNTVFSRFANEDRIEIGDIDVDIAPCDREKVFKYIIDRFETDHTSFVVTTGTLQDKGTIDEICRALKCTNKAEIIKAEYAQDSEKARKTYPEIFYYFDGLKGTVVQKGMHPAAIIISPIPLSENYGVYHHEGKRVISINMDEIHEVSLVKYDILGLKNVGIIKSCCEFTRKPYPKSHQIDWEHEQVWETMRDSNIGIFQFEGEYAGQCLKQFKPRKINDLSLVNAAIRPAGATYRKKLLAKEIRKNPSPLIGEMLKDNYGYLVFQEDTIKFLKDICGLTGSEADNIRRAIARKQKDRLTEALPKILEGYCSKSTSDPETAKQEAQEFLQIIEDSSNYQFGYNHTTGYSMLGYMCAYMRYFHPVAFCTSLLRNAETEEDIIKGTELAMLKGINIRSAKYGCSSGQYTPGRIHEEVYKGVESIKYCNKAVGDILFAMSRNHIVKFMDLLLHIKETPIDRRQLTILIKLDFFSKFGNSKELLTLLDAFYDFKRGESKQIDKSKPMDDVIRSIIKRHSKETTYTYNIIDINGILKDIEKYVKTMNIQDYTMKEKVQMQLEYTGYVDIKTGLEEDKNKLLVVKIDKIKTKNKKRIWAYKVKTLALRTGTRAELTIVKNVFESNPIVPLDIIHVDRQCLTRRTTKDYVNWYLSGYKILEQE